MGNLTALSAYLIFNLQVFNVLCINVASSHLVHFHAFFERAVLQLPWYFYLVLQPYLSNTRSLSPMSGLFGSIWAPQSDVYESCCPVSATTQHSTHVENQAVMCKQEYYPRFNPFRAYMNLDIWTTAANRNPNFPLSRDSGYCGNVWKEFDLKMWIKMPAILITRVSWLLNRLQCWWIFWHFYIENKFFFFYWSLRIRCILKRKMFKTLLLSGEGYKSEPQNFSRINVRFLKASVSPYCAFLLRFTFCGIN